MNRPENKPKTLNRRAPQRLTACSMALATAFAAHTFGGWGATAALAQPRQHVKSVADVKTMLTTSLPGDSQDISAAMAKVKVGETVTIRGYIPESDNAFARDVAEFTLVEAPATKSDHDHDHGHEHDHDNGDSEHHDHVHPQTASATIRIVDAKGQLVKGSLRNEHGLKPRAEVFVTGTIASANGKGGLVVHAMSMYIPRASLPAGFFADKAPKGALDVSEARKAGTIKVGDQVALRGRVGGSGEPFVAGRAAFTLMGRGLKACNENPDDKCAEPWDYCCETREEILANSVTVQIVDAKSQVLRTDMKGRRGLKELSEVVVVGKVAMADDKAVVINATSMYVVE